MGNIPFSTMTSLLAVWSKVSDNEMSAILTYRDSDQRSVDNSELAARLLETAENCRTEDKVYVHSYIKANG